MEWDGELIDYVEGVARFSGRAELYQEFLLRFFRDPLFGELCAAVESGDFPSAFRCAHTLKGNAGNLSLTALYDALLPLADLLRTGTDITRAVDMLHRLRAVYDRTAEMIEANLS